MNPQAWWPRGEGATPPLPANDQWPSMQPQHMVVLCAVAQASGDSNYL